MFMYFILAHAGMILGNPPVEAWKTQMEIKIKHLQWERATKAVLAAEAVSKGEEDGSRFLSRLQSVPPSREEVASVATSIQSGVPFSVETSIKGHVMRCSGVVRATKKEEFVVKIAIEELVNPTSGSPEQRRISSTCTVRENEWQPLGASMTITSSEEGSEFATHQFAVMVKRGSKIAQLGVAP